MSAKPLNVDIKALYKEAIDILDNREKTYSSYREHVKIYSQIVREIRNDLFDCMLESKVANGCELTDFDYEIGGHAAHCIALKLARIATNPSHKDSYVDTFGYLMLFLENTCADFVFIRQLRNQAKVVNDFINTINDTFKK